jgi:hypothetical protein
VDESPPTHARETIVSSRYGETLLQRSGWCMKTERRLDPSAAQNP